MRPGQLEMRGLSGCVAVGQPGAASVGVFGPQRGYFLVTPSHALCGRGAPEFGVNSLKRNKNTGTHLC